MSERYGSNWITGDAFKNTAKRLSGPELAAEYWRALQNLYAGMGENPWTPEADRIDTLERFARLPHYDEEPA